MSLLRRSVGEAVSSLGLLEKDLEYSNGLVFAKLFLIADWNGNCKLEDRFNLGTIFLNSAE